MKGKMSSEYEQLNTEDITELKSVFLTLAGGEKTTVMAELLSRSIFIRGMVVPIGGSAVEISQEQFLVMFDTILQRMSFKDQVRHIEIDGLRSAMGEVEWQEFSTQLGLDPDSQDRDVRLDAAVAILATQP